MKLSHKTFLLLIIYLLPSYLTAQNPSSILIKGTVFSQKAQKPLPYVTVSLQNGTLGTVTNQKGRFELKIPKQLENIELVFSYVGFLPMKIPVKQAISQIKYFIQEDVQVLKEVVVTGLSAEAIVQKALDNIPKNYYQAPYVSQGFYRLTTQKENDYIQASEAVFDIYNARPAKENQLKLYKMRAIKNEKLMENMELRLKPSSVFASDIVQHLNDFKLLNKKGRKRHHFSFKGTKKYQNSEVYIIAFDQKKGLKKSGYKGEFWVDTQTFAFVFFDIGLSPRGIKYRKVGNVAERALMRILSLKIKVLQEREQYKYQRIGDKYYFQEAKIHLRNSIKNGRQHFNYISDSRLHYVVTGLKRQQVKPFSDEEVLKNKQWIENQDQFFDKGYWDAYNIVLPDVDFATIAKNIIADNEANKLKVEVDDWLRSCPRDKAARMDSIITYYNRKGLFAGNALVAYQGKVLLSKSYNNTLTKNTAQSQFRIGSTSKTFTSMLIMLLEKEGKLKLNDQVGKFLPNYVHPQITIAQLLTHQSGIPNYTVNADYLQQILAKPFSSEELVQKFCSDSLDFAPGKQFSYSNSGFVVLGRIIEKITQKPMGEVLQAKIFQPLKMTHTFFAKSLKASQIAKGYLYNKAEPVYPIQNNLGAGGIFSTTADLLKWSKALDQDDLLPNEKRKQLFVPRAEYKDWDANYGYGWMIDRYQFKASKRHQVVFHPGTDLGFHTMFLKQPDEQITIILLGNIGQFPRFEMSELILNELN